ncbi:integral membrane protein TerC family [Escherichia coli MS 107-1]|nr:integral membrane protein TerC family [Escherichia coli MS 107-1]
MEFLMDPSIWAGLLTLVVLEIVLGIDNLVFIAILADKLPPKQRDKARLLGLSLALIMRLGAAVADFMDGHADQTAIYRHGFLLLRTRPDYVVRGDILAVQSNNRTA